MPINLRIGLGIGNAGRAAKAAVGPSISYIGASSSMYASTSSTSASVAKPIGVQDGDYLVLAVVARSAVTLSGTGSAWTLLGHVGDGSLAQFLEIYGKVASGAADRTNAVGVNQATANPLNASVMAFRGSTGIANFSGLTPGVQLADTSNVGQIPVRTPLVAGSMALGICSTGYYPSGGPSGTPSLPWASAYPGGVFARRMWLATRAVPADLSAFGVTITPSWTTTTAITWLNANLVIKPTA